MKKWIALALTLTLIFSVCAFGTSAYAAEEVKKPDGYPKKDVSVIVPYSAGGTTDLSTRGVIDAIPDGMFDKNFIVSNVAGGSGLVGSAQFANAAPDGYTIGVLNCDLVLNNVFGYTDITSDQFVPLCCVENDPYVFMVSKDAPYQTFEEFVDYAREHPGEIAVADSGNGSVTHLPFLALTDALGLDVRSVAYDSSADGAIAVVSGEVQVNIGAVGSAAGQLEAGELVALATTSNERLTTMPDVPAMGELYEELSDARINSWVMLAVDADVDPEIIAYLQSMFGPAAASDEYREMQASFNFQAVDEMDNDQLLEFVAEQHDYYVSVVG